jgi:hypothetical protein
MHANSSDNFCVAHHIPEFWLRNWSMGMTYDSPVGVWNELYETPLGGKRSNKVTFVDESIATYTSMDGRVEFYEIDENGWWKAYWINESGSQECSEARGGSVFWGEQIYQFNETYNRYKGTWDICGQGPKYAINGVR